MEKQKTFKHKDTENKKSNIAAKIILILFAIFLCVGGISIGVISCFNEGKNTGGIVSTKAYTYKCEYREGFGYYVTIKGTLTNTSKNEYTNVSIVFSCYDSAGNDVGTCVAEKNNFKPNDTWNYEATHMDWFNNKVTKVQLAKITYS